MVFDVDIWLKAYVQAVQARFGPRIRLIGLQGSFSRGEASEGSDVDVVLILDAVSARDLADYSEALDGLPPVKMHCSLLAEQALKEALEDYFKKNNLPLPEGFEKPDAEHEEIPEEA